MADIVAFKYRAFLSYSHRDKRWARQLHAALERYPEQQLESVTILRNVFELALAKVEAVAPASGPEHERIDLAKRAFALASGMRGSEGASIKVYAAFRIAFVTIFADFKLGVDPEHANDAASGAYYEAFGDFAQANQRFEGALTSYLHSLAVWKFRAENERHNVVWQRALARTYDNIGDVLRELRRPKEALDYYRSTLAMRQRFASSDPANTSWQQDLSVSYGKIGDAQLAGNDLAAALASYRQSVQIRERLVIAAPNNTFWQIDLAIGYSNLAYTLAKQDRIVEAIAYYRKSLSIREELFRSDQTNLPQLAAIIELNRNLANYRDNQTVRYELVVAGLRKLRGAKLELTDDQEQWLSEAEHWLAGNNKQQ